MGNGKTNRFAFVFYPESVSFETVFGLLRASHTKAMFSPLHDRDTWTSDSCFERYEDMFRSTPDGFLTLEIRSYDVKDTGERINDAREVRIYKSKKDLNMSRLLSYVENLETGEKRAYNSKAELEEGLKDSVWILDGFRVTYLHSAQYMPKGSIPYDLPVPGDPKKAHYHVITKFDYSLTVQNALGKLGISEYINYMQRINSETGYIRYLCHLDDPDKYRYDELDVITIGGYSTDPLYMQGAVDCELANDDLFKLANNIKKKGGGFSDMVDSVQCLDWKVRKAFRSNQAMWKNYLYKPIVQPK